MLTETPNRNLRPIYDMLYLIVLPENDIPRVLCTSPNIGSASAVIKSNIKWRYWQLYTHKPWSKPEIKITNFDDLDVVYSLRKELAGVSRQELSKELAEELRPTRVEAQTRTKWHDSLLADCELALSLNSENPMLAKFVDSISHELGKCDPVNNVYTNSIVDYATIQEISNATAYAELSMHADEINNARIRNYAIYLRFRNEMNLAPGTREALGNIHANAKNLLLNNRLL